MKAFSANDNWANGCTGPAFNHKKPVLYVSEFENGAIVCDPHHDRLLRLNPTAIKMWKLLADGYTQDQVVHAMSEEFHVVKDRVAADLRDLLDRIVQFKLQVDSQLLISSASSDRQESLIMDSSALRDERKEVCGRIKRRWILQAFLGLIAVDIVFASGSIKRLLSAISKSPLTTQAPSDDRDLISCLCTAVQRACIWYPKRALCLQRAAVTTWLLRRNGVPSDMIIGVRSIPLLAHAWVEVNGIVVNDFARLRSFYQVVTTA